MKRCHELLKSLPCGISRLFGMMALPLIALIAACGEGPSSPSQMDTAARPVAVRVEGESHSFDALLGGVVWVNSKTTARKIAAETAKLPDGLLVAIKGPMLGYRFDLDSWESGEGLGSTGTETDAPNLDEVFTIYGSPNTRFVLCLPSPSPATLGGTDSNGIHAYLWQTPAYYAALCQYLFGTADTAAADTPLDPRRDFFTTDPDFNWANLRARRGRLTPYPVEAVIIGGEPYNEGWGHDGGGYGGYVAQVRAAIRARGITVPYGVCLDYQSAYHDNSWFDPMLAALGSMDLPSYYDFTHVYQFEYTADWNRSFPVSVRNDGFAFGWTPRDTWGVDYTRFMYYTEDLRMGLSKRGLPLSPRMGWSEHGILVSTQFAWNGMDGALFWANWLSEVMRTGVGWDAIWTLGAEGYSTALVQVVGGKTLLPPAYEVYRLALGLRGRTVLNLSYQSPEGQCQQAGETDPQGKPVMVSFPWIVIRGFRDPSTGSTSLFVVNQSLSDSFRITGFETKQILNWEEVSGSSYSDGDPFHAPFVNTFSGKRMVRGDAPLIIRPCSVTRIDLG